MYFRANIEQMAGYVSGEQPRTGKFIKLNTNENPYPHSPAVTRAIQNALDAGLAVYPDAVANAFRIAAAEHLGVEPDWILCGNGSDDILTILTRAMVGENDLLRLPYPSYVLYRTLAEIQGARFEEVPFSPDWTLPAQFVEPDAGLKLVFLPNPNSPSGTLISPEEISSLAEQLSCPILIDEAYVDYATMNCIDLVRSNEKIMVSRSLSKSYALAGLRFGFLVAQPQMIQQLMKVKDSYNCDSLSIVGATAAISDKRWLAANVEKITSTRTRMHSELEKLGFEVVPSQANFLWCVRGDGLAQSLYEQLKQNQVLVRYMNYPGWGDGLRISVGTDEQIDALLGLLSQMV